MSGKASLSGAHNRSGQIELGASSLFPATTKHGWSNAPRAIAACGGHAAPASPHAPCAPTVELALALGDPKCRVILRHLARHHRLQGRAVVARRGLVLIVVGVAGAGDGDRVTGTG
jgi:hypothetical protein